MPTSVTRTQPMMTMRRWESTQRVMETTINRFYHKQSAPWCKFEHTRCWVPTARRPNSGSSRGFS